MSRPAAVGLESHACFRAWTERNNLDGFGAVLVCGSRDWTDARPIASVIERVSPGTVVITGGARGADRIAHDLAVAHGLPTAEFPADWDRHGRRAGYVRNEVMASCAPGRVFAFALDIETSRGTRHMCRIAFDAGIPVTLHDRATNRVTRHEPLPQPF